MVFSPSNQSQFSDAEYRNFRQFLEKSCGILLGDNKQYLVDSRLRKLLKDNDMQTLGQLLKEIERPSSPRLRQQVIDAMTTNETLWFRDRHPFEYLQSTLLPDLAKSPGDINIWCAACSTGQEPYSISICVEELRRKNYSLSNKNVRILATDISSRVLDAAKRGLYEPLQLKRGMSDERLDLYFKHDNEGAWEVKPEIKRRIDFRQINLKDSFINVGKFDIVFCRNVLIYFSSDLQKQIVSNIHRVLNPGGYLFLGGSETPKGLNDLFEIRYYTPGVVYIKK
ncbi:MAG TPA: protein-glutamate O-methyltransferase CheR [Dongiaceae bacterium]|nr:protein-glutamate O-methyltransferase CheR [Dongiaceae bacterium]